jgi:hypothetical protein
LTEYHCRLVLVLVLALALALAEKRREETSQQQLSEVAPFENAAKIH